jgi:hypothetical protein
MRVILEQKHLGSSSWHPSTLKQPQQADPKPSGPASTVRRPSATLTSTLIPTLPSSSSHPPPSGPPTTPLQPPPPKLTTNTDQTGPTTHLECSRAGQDHGGSNTTDPRPRGAAGLAITARSLAAASKGMQGGGGRVVEVEGQIAAHRA